MIQKLLCCIFIINFLITLSVTAQSKFIDGKNSKVSPDFKYLISNGNRYVIQYQQWMKLNGITVNSTNDPTAYTLFLAQNPPDTGRTIHAPRIIAKEGKGSNSIAFQLDGMNTPIQGYPKVNQPAQRVEVSWVTNIPFYKTRYTGFRLKIDGSSEVPFDDSPYDRNCVITQWWQIPGEGPPLYVEIKHANTLSVYVGWQILVYRLQNQPGPVGKLKLAQKNIKADQWYDIVLGYLFDPVGTNGMVKMWCAESKMGDLKSEELIDYTGPIGFDFGAQEIITHKFGLYRMANSKSLKVHFNHLRFGLTFKSVDPRQ